MSDTDGRLAFLFHPGHGHYTQFLNFRECFPPGQAGRADWVPLDGEVSGDPLCRLPGLPGGMRYRRHRQWNARRALASRSDWQAVFFAAEQLSFTPLMQSHPSYLYTDLTPSLKRELAPWYDHQLRVTPGLGAFRQALWRRLFHSCRGIFTMSRWAADGVMRDYGVPAERVHVVLPGANLSRWPFVDRSGRPTEHPVRILMVGGQFRLKGGEMLLDWAERTARRDWEMDIVTWPGELPDWVRALLPASGTGSVSLGPRLPRVRIHCGLTANTPELMALYEQADIFCLPTQADGSSIASLEAMASGLPVLVSAAGGIPELIRDGETGLLLKRGDVDDLETKLELLIGDAPRRLEIGQAARRSCEEFFNVSRQLHEILAVLGDPRQGNA